MYKILLQDLARLLNEKIFFADLDFSTIPFKGLENIANIGDFPTLHHERKRVFDDKFSGSIKGAAFVRDEEYVTGAYFRTICCYYTTWPITPILKEKLNVPRRLSTKRGCEPCPS